jgi:hypothetical protein
MNVTIIRICARILSFLFVVLVFAPILKATFAGVSATTSRRGPPISKTAQTASSSVVVALGESSIYPNQSATLTATVSVTGTGNASPTGTVQFSIGANTLGTPVALTAVDSNDSSATITLPGSQLATGPNSITAVYSGDTNYAGSASTVVTVTLLSSQVGFGSSAVGTAAPVQTL